MNIIFILSIFLAIFGIVVALIKTDDEYDKNIKMYIIIICFSLFALSLTGGFLIIRAVKEENLQKLKEREQIIYQIEHLTEGTDKTKLNEWILTYNDWVIMVNTDKEIRGWFSKYKDLDMSNHIIIDLV